jgi:bifunctional UDP-N-acetylglucosamine pyrophosphorylase/glucosamine-1-phosphate N-acetyltransferase
MSLYSNLQSVILAAGKSTRFHSNKTKLVENICGRPVVLYTAKLFEELSIDSIFVVGHQKELIQETVSNNVKNKVSFVHQKEQLGTGHAVACTKELWDKENILIVNGDVPLIDKNLIETLYTKHNNANAHLSFVVSTCPHQNHAYGRIIKDESGIKIVEAKDFVKEEYDKIRHISHDINAGIYIARASFLNNCINKINTENASKEFYLTDLVKIASDSKLNVLTHAAPFDRVMGINTNYELMLTEEIKRSDIIKHWASQGVKFETTFGINIDIDVEIGQYTSIEYGVQILSGSKIGRNCIIKKLATIENSTLEDFVTVHQNSIIRDSYLCLNSKIGPFSHVHSHSMIEQDTVINNFVEIKSSTIGSNSYVMPLSYIGNTVTEPLVNIGAGTITCNYDGVSRHSTTIKNSAFIGSNNTLVAPIVIGENSFTAAGSTITEDVPSNSLALARAKQVNKEDYVQGLLEKLRLRSSELIDQENQTLTNNFCKFENNDKTDKNSSNANINSIPNKNSQANI